MTRGGRRGQPGPPAQSDALFATRWVHVFEEDSAESAVYRPETDEVPLSRRPRQRLSLAPDGSATVLLPGPDDRLIETAGFWREEGGELVVRAGREGGRGGPVLRIVDRSPDRLVVRK